MVSEREKSHEPVLRKSPSLFLRFVLRREVYQKPAPRPKFSKGKKIGIPKAYLIPNFLDFL